VSKTVEELIGVYIEASNAVVWEAEKRGLCPMTLDMQRAGIAAVVSELMEHFVTGASTYAWDADDLHAEFMKILGAAGDEAAAACATSQTEGEVHDGRISQSLSPTRRGRSEVAGPLEGSGSGATPDNQRGEEVARAVFGNHEAGRKRDVGGEGNNGLNEKVAGGSTREDEKAVEAAGDKGPVTVNSPATDPCPDCGGRKYLAKHALNGTYYVHCHCPKLKATDAAPAVCVWAYDVRTDPWPWRSSCGNGWRDSKRTCPQCKKQVKFTEANHG